MNKYLVPLFLVQFLCIPGLTACGDGSSDSDTVPNAGGASGGCSVIDHKDGSKTISCEDGSQAVIHDGANGTDGSQGGAGADGSSCGVIDNQDGSKTISCEDGSKVVIQDGANGTDGSSSLVKIVEDTYGACPTTGYRILVGVDDDGDGVLGNEEIDTARFVCGSETASPVFTEAQVVDGMVLACSSHTTLRCNGPTLNGNVVSYDNATKARICSVLFGTTWGSSGGYPAGTAEDSYAYASEEWVLRHHTTLVGYFTCKHP